jgi:hypothetical protein
MKEGQQFRYKPCNAFAAGYTLQKHFKNRRIKLMITEAQQMISSLIWEQMIK